MQNQMSGMHAGNDEKDGDADLVIDDDKNTTTSKMFQDDSKLAL